MLGPPRNSVTDRGNSNGGGPEVRGEGCPRWLERGSQAASGKRGGWGGVPGDPGACYKGVKSQSLQGPGPKQPGPPGTWASLSQGQREGCTGGGPVAAGASREAVCVCFPEARAGTLGAFQAEPTGSSSKSWPHTVLPKDRSYLLCHLPSQCLCSASHTFTLLQAFPQA